MNHLIERDRVLLRRDASDNIFAPTTAVSILYEALSFENMVHGRMERLSGGNRGEALLSTQVDERTERRSCDPFSFPRWWDIDVLEFARKGLKRTDVLTLYQNIVSQYPLGKSHICRTYAVDVVRLSHSVQVLRCLLLNLVLHLTENL